MANTLAKPLNRDGGLKPIGCRTRFPSRKSSIRICGRSESRQSRDRLESFNEKNPDRWVVTSKQRVYMVVGTVGRQRFTSEPTDIPDLRHDRDVGSGGFFEMRGMLPPSEARMRMCVMQVGKRGRWTYRDWIRWRFLWKFFPWYARELRYRGDFCIGAGCMHWFWEDPDKKERGYCSVAVSRTQNMMWAKEMDERDKPAARSAKP
jgi:hypothetical protein